MSVLLGERRRLESSYERSYARSMLDQSQPRVRSDGERDRPAGIWCSMSCLPINGRNRHRPRAVPFIMPAIRNTRMHSQRVDQIGESGVIAILRGVDPESAIDVATAVIDGGVTALEVTADTPNVAETIGSLSDRFDDVLVGAGRFSTPRPPERYSSRAPSSSLRRRSTSASSRPEIATQRRLRPAHSLRQRPFAPTRPAPTS